MHRWDLADPSVPHEFATCFRDRCEPYLAQFTDLERLNSELVQGRLPPFVRISEAVELLLATAGPSAANAAAVTWFAARDEASDRLSWHLAQLREHGVPNWGFLDPEEGVARLIVEGVLRWDFH